ncbi:hypothetical protein DRJ19_00605 [Candidatus Woesearchaeota archaeon]|nr:MAG: hypothetical protein DRJ19_00605 [Candidatus Woesearchaeota archaeon]RLE44383.1 MAG: hypothetical protein DRJ16_02330 [Candidatus Woesearchaeota archaeon]
MARILVLTCHPSPEGGVTNVRKSYGKAEYVALAEYYVTNEPDREYEILELRVNLDEAEADEKSITESFKNLCSELGRLPPLGDTIDVFKKVTELFEDIKLPYTTRGIKATIYDSGGDYPTGRFKAVYYA